MNRTPSAAASGAAGKGVRPIPEAPHDESGLVEPLSDEPGFVEPDVVELFSLEQPQRKPPAGTSFPMKNLAALYSGRSLRRNARCGPPPGEAAARAAALQHNPATCFQSVSGSYGPSTQYINKLFQGSQNPAARSHARAEGCIFAFRLRTLSAGCGLKGLHRPPMAAQSPQRW